MTLQELERLLDQQKEITIEALLQHSYMYNSESTDNNLKHLTIDKEKFTRQGMKSGYPHDLKVLKRYLK